MNKILSFLSTNKIELLIVAVVLCIAGISHGYNMFHFPYYENDEGVYMSQAWSLLKEGNLAPYTYWYDHAPAGWIFIALWNLLTGGFYTFGFSINSGRVFMLVLHILSSLLLYLIGKRMTNSKMVGIVSVVIFSLTPLGIYFQRRVLLDNIMTFWILLSLFLLLHYRNKLRYIILSAIAFGIGVLSKENAIFLAPVFLYIIYSESHEKHRSFALIKWISIVAIITTIYFIYAFIKGELFPSGTLFGGNNEHVSLLRTLQDQYSRGGGGILNPSKSSFWSNMFDWVKEDPLIIYAGVLATIINLLVGIKNQSVRIISLLSASLWLFLARGGLVIEFYIVPLIPLLALNIAVVGWLLQRRINNISKTTDNNFISYTPYFLLLILFIFSSMYLSMRVRGGSNLYTSDQTTPQINAINWMLSRDTSNAFYVIDNYGYIELHDKATQGFRRAEWYWKVDRDPAIRDDILHGSPENIDYIALTPQMENDISTVGLNISLTAWHNSQPIGRFWNDGWGVEFWATRYPKQILTRSWDSYKNNFIKEDGQTIDPYTNNVTTSEGQSYTLLRSVWMDDKSQFDKSWTWTKDNLQISNSLFKWVSGNIPQGRYESKNIGTVTSSDEDIALALAFAYKKWGDNNYLIESKKIIQSIWNNEVIVQKKIPYITAGDWVKSEDEIIINPSYLSPYSYRIFSQIDTEHNWMKVVDSSYKILSACSAAKLDVKKSVNIAPDWCAISKNGTVGVSSKKDLSSTSYSYDASKSTWRIAIDYIWYKDTRAKEYLNSNSFIRKEWNNTKKVIVAYTHDGKPWENYESASAYGANIGNFMIIERDTANEIYLDKISTKFFEDNGNSYWEDPKSYYTQNWAWFGTALYTNNLPNLWEK